MPKSSAVFVCRECGGESIRWGGQCPHCRAWNTLEEFVVPRAGRDQRRSVAVPARPVPLTKVDLQTTTRLELDWQELNRVLGGGVVPGSLVLLGGEPGVGKSTLLTHLAAQAATRGRTVLYASGEESAQQVGLRAHRLGLASAGVLLLAENDVDAIIGAIERERPSISIVDSIQTVQDAAVEAAPGSVSQVREATNRLMRAAKASGVHLNRLHMIVAVLEKHADMKLGGHDVLVNVAGGLRVQEPAADLGLALAIVSSYRERALPERTVVIGELGLTGEIRRVGRMERRLQEAARRGFARAIVPRGAGESARDRSQSGQMECLEVKELREAVALCR